MVLMTVARIRTTLSRSSPHRMQLRTAVRFNRPDAGYPASDRFPQLELDVAWRSPRVQITVVREFGSHSALRCGGHGFDWGARVADGATDARDHALDLRESNRHVTTRNRQANRM